MHLCHMQRPGPAYSTTFFRAARVSSNELFSSSPWRKKALTAWHMPQAKSASAIGPFLVFADLHQQLHFRILGQNLAQGLSRGLVLLVHHGVHDAADAGLDVDGGIMVGSGQLARKHDMPVKDGPGLVGDGFGHVITFHQHRVQGGDGTLVRIARPFHELGQFRKDRRREAPAGRRLSGRQTDLALGASETGHGIHHQQHALALIAEIFGNGRGRIRGLEPLHGRTVRRGDHEHGFFATFRTDVAFDEFPHFTATFADERQHADIGRAAP